MTDLTLTRNSELSVTQVEGNTEAGVEFVDAWPGSTMEVVDSGRILLPEDAIPALRQAALRGSLTIAYEDQPMSGFPIPELTDGQRLALARVRETYGDNPQAVGAEDGTEDDFGDLIADTLNALGLVDDREPEYDDAAWQRADDAATYCDSESLEEWARVLLGAWNGTIPAVPS